MAIREIAVGSAGIYVPGGGAALASTALMCAIPARVAGVGRIALASPPGREGHVSSAVLAACDEAGVDEVYATGGAQAIAALALGTETIAPVDLIAGPGNPYTQEAKRQLYGLVGIDGIAGPSELMVIIGESARIEWIALDLCAQAEHGADSPLVATAVETRIARPARRAGQRARRAPGRASPTPPLALIAVPDTDAALALANAYAPEHLQIATEDAEIQAASVTTAGCVFIGEYAATAFGDYAAGSNHVLPTGGAGRFQGPLGPSAFRRRIANVSLPGPAAEALAPAHGRARPGRGIARPRRVGNGEGMTRAAEQSRKTKETEIRVSVDLDGGAARRSPPGSGSSTTCSSCSPATATSACGSRPAATSRPAPTTRSRTSGSSSGRRSTSPSASAPGSAATARRWCRWTSRWPSARSTSRAGRCASTRRDLPATSIAGFDTELAEEFFRAFAASAKLTLHISVRRGTNAHHMIEACFKAFARALRGGGR